MTEQPAAAQHVHAFDYNVIPGDGFCRGCKTKESALQTAVQVGVEMATVERLDRIVETVKERREGAEREAGDLDSYTNILDWAMDIACEDGTPEQWAHAEREEFHQAATLGPLVLIEVDANVERGLCGAVYAAQGTVTYEPVYASAIAWFLNVAKWSGHPAPGEG